MSKISFVSRMTARPGRRDALLAALERLVTAAVSDEPGTELFVMNLPEDDPDAVISFEVFRDEAALAQHVASPAVAAFVAEMDALLARPPEPVRARPGPSKGLAQTR